MIRLTQKETKTIQDTILSFLDDAKVYLFGSRTKDHKKGGDIDLFIISKNSSFDIKIKITSKLKYLLNKPVDIVMHQDFQREIEQEALRGERLF